MKRVGLILTLTTVAVLGIATVVSAGITIEKSGPGAAPGDSIYSGAEVRFDVRLHNNSGGNIDGMTNGFIMYSPDGAAWAPPVTTLDSGFVIAFDLDRGINEFSVDGMGADTIGIWGVKLHGSGLPNGYDGIIATMSTSVDTSQVGKTLCIDSVFFPPSGYWLWAIDGGTNYHPSWGGPYCYPIIPGSSVPDGGITVELSGPGAGPGNTINCNQPVTFNINLDNTTGEFIQGMTNGYRIYSPDGATWQPPISDTVGGLGAYLDGGVFINEFSIDGMGADTIGLGGFYMFTNGIPPGYNETVMTITTQVSCVDSGFTLCIDSSFYPPVSKWLWSTSGGNVYPSWGGPYCYDIAYNDPPPDPGAVILDHVTGSPGGDSIVTGAPITFHLRMNNTTGVPIEGFSHGFMVYSPDGAQWSNSWGDTTGSPLFPHLDGGLFINEFSTDGMGADTVAFAGFRMFQPGIPVGFNEVTYSIHIGPIDSSYVGRHICLDSCFFPPGGDWMWSVALGTEEHHPNWAGPHCFTIIPGPDSLGGPPDSLIVPSVVTGPCNAVQPVSVKLTQHIKGASIPLAIPPDVEVESISFEGLITEGWNYNVSQIKPDSGFIYVALANSSGYMIPPGDHVVFNVHFNHAGNCDTSAIVRWDTALDEDPTRHLLFADATNFDLPAGFDYYRDVTIVPEYLPGDFDGDGNVIIMDLTGLVAHLFLGGPAACVANAMDMNASCTGPNIADLTYLVDYLFQGGPDPNCGCIGDAPAPAKIASDIMVVRSYENGYTTIAIETPITLRGVQLELIGNSGGIPTSLLGSEIDMIHGSDGSVIRIGLLDLDGASVIATGITQIVQLEGEYQVSEAVVSDAQHQDFTATIAGKLESLPDDFTLEQNYPNPFNPTTEIGFNLPKSSKARLEVYNIMGQRVAVLADRTFEAGRHIVQWHSTDSHGSRVASGVYFYRLETEGFTETKKMLLLK
ncbi:MAG: T9SS type A sorting domain-containing protein [candidate division Zixibacteria bacterium]|nr:T9SS type A sorting domain-containing protein [candidate division Zixibacteria bacterium]